MPFDPTEGSRYMHLFFDSGDGTCEYRRLDFVGKGLETFKTLEGISFEDVWSVEGVKKIRQDLGDYPVSIVQCSLANLDLGDITDYVCTGLEGIMNLKFPKFYEENTDGMKSPKHIHVHIHKTNDDGEFEPLKTMEINDETFDATKECPTPKESYDIATRHIGPDSPENN